MLNLEEKVKNQLFPVYITFHYTRIPLSFVNVQMINIVEKYS